MGCLGVIKETIILWLQNHINKYLNEINFLQTNIFLWTDKSQWLCFPVI